MLKSLYQIILHREYIPLIPICYNGPNGPTNDLTFPNDECPNGWWRKSTKQVFKSAKDIINLIELCQRKDKLPQSNIVLFAIWTAVFIGLYAYHFPHINTERYILSETHKNSLQKIAKTNDLYPGPTALAYKTLERISA